MPTSRPVILLGHGVRAAGAEHLVPKVLNLGIPVLTSWQAKDLVPFDHPLYFGSPGIYGTRCANKVLAAADEILAIGNRMAIWNVGYAGPRKDQTVVMVDLDGEEARKFEGAQWVCTDAKSFIEYLPAPDADLTPWLSQCANWRLDLPHVEYPTHADQDGYINSYRFFDRLNEYLRPDEVIAIDCGSACSSAFQVLHVKPPQRILSSGGLGEMGCALPAAIGASFARRKGPVVCIVGDGAMMMNLQELQTVVHHRLPIKIIVCRNDGYLMLKHTMRASGMRYSGVSEETGVSTPNFRLLANIFGITGAEVRSWEDFDRIVPSCMASDAPCLIEYQMHPEQVIGPKLGYHLEDGKPVYDSFAEMSPRYG